MLFAAIWMDLEIIILSEVKPLLCFTRLVMTDSFVIPWAVAPRLLCPWDFLGKIIGVDCHFLLQGMFPTQGSNPGVLHCWQILYRLNHQGSPV